VLFPILFPILFRRTLHSSLVLLCRLHWLGVFQILAVVFRPGAGRLPRTRPTESASDPKAVPPESGVEPLPPTRQLVPWGSSLALTAPHLANFRLGRIVPHREPANPHKGTQSAPVEIPRNVLRKRRCPHHQDRHVDRARSAAQAGHVCAAGEHT